MQANTCKQIYLYVHESGGEYRIRQQLTHNVYLFRLRVHKLPLYINPYKQSILSNKSSMPVGDHMQNRVNIQGLEVTITH